MLQDNVLHAFRKPPKTPESVDPPVSPKGVSDFTMSSGNKGTWGTEKPTATKSKETKNNDINPSLKRHLLMGRCRK
jgi:hypothetical protein